MGAFSGSDNGPCDVIASDSAVKPESLYWGNSRPPPLESADYLRDLSR